LRGPEINKKIQLWIYFVKSLAIKFQVVEKLLIKLARVFEVKCIHALMRDRKGNPFLSQYGQQIIRDRKN